MIKGSDIKDARNRAGMSQEELAAAVGVTLRTIGNWERSATAPRDRLPILREVLGDYLGDSESKSPRLRAASDLELINEIARRLARATGEAGTGRGKPAEKSPDDDGGQVIEGDFGIGGPEPGADLAADRDERPSQKQRATVDQEAAGEENQDSNVKGDR